MVEVYVGENLVIVLFSFFCAFFGNICLNLRKMLIYFLGQAIRMVISNVNAGHFYSRLVPLVLLLVDGNSFTCLCL